MRNNTFKDFKFPKFNELTPYVRVMKCNEVYEFYYGFEEYGFLDFACGIPEKHIFNRDILKTYVECEFNDCLLFEYLYNQMIEKGVM